MLLFSTVLPINEKMTKEAFIKLAIDWNQKSRHPENVIHSIVWNKERNIRFGDDKVWMQIEEYRNKNIIAIRYEKIQEDGVIWDTDFVMSFNDMKMSIRLDRSYLEDALTIYPSFSTPAFLALLIDGGYVKDDNGLPVERKPTPIDEENISLIADVINGQVHYDLPVVYISKTYDEREPVNVKEVAKRLKGAAHVFYQKDSWTEAALQRLCKKKNEYDGAIGLYFPNQAVGHEKILNHIYAGSSKKMADKVVQRVIQYSNVQKIDSLFTWEGVNNALLRDKYSSKREELAASESARKLSEHSARIKTLNAELRAQNAAQKAEELRKEAEEARELIDSVDGEIAELNKKIEAMSDQIHKLTKENDSLRGTNQGLWAKLNEMSKKPLLYFGSEEEFFPGEIREFVLLAVEEKLKKTKAKTRRADVLGDVLRSNGNVTGVPEKKMKRVKEILIPYTSMTNTVRSFLEDLGFKIKDDGKHYKLTYYGDGRYWTTLAKTPSDKARGGLNAATEIIRSML